MMTVTLRSGDDVDLVLYRLDAVAPPSAAALSPARAVLLVHGAFSSHTIWLRGGSRNAGLAVFLSAAGYDVWLADWRSHGSAAREPRPRAWHFEDAITQDAPALAGYVRDVTAGVPPVWVGHSVGGAIGLAHLARHPGALAAVVTLGTPGPVMELRRRCLALGTIAICHALGRFPARAFRMGPEDEAALVLAEWMEWNLHGRWVGAGGFDYLAALRHVRTPVLAVAGEGDHLFAPPAACRALADRVGDPPATFAVAGPQLGHSGLLLDPKADTECWPLVARWIGALEPARRATPRSA
ncbi:MAG: alpha/beta fold hydrolase [Gemmatimonadota bacterium]